MKRKFLHPDEACARLGLVPQPNEGACAKYNRRRHLAKMGLKQYTGPFRGYRYDEAEVDAQAAKIQVVKRAA